MRPNKQPELPKTLWSFIWYFLRNFKLPMLAFIFLSIIAGFWGPLNSLLVKNIIDILPTAQTNISLLVWPAALIVLNFIVLDNITWRSITYIRGKYAPVIVSQITASLMSYILSQSHQFFQDKLSGKISKQISILAEEVDGIVISKSADILRGIFLLLSSFVAAYFANPIFCAIIAVWFMVFSTISLIMSQKVVVLAKNFADAEALVSGEVVDTISNQNNIRIFANQSFEKIRMKPFLNEYKKAYQSLYFYSLFMHVIQGTLIAVLMAVSLYFLVKLYGQGVLTTGDFALILGLTMNTGHMLWYTMYIVDRFNKSIGRCKQSLSALMLPLDIKDKSNAIKLECNKGEISFNSVTFQYKDVDPLFKNKNVIIKANEKVGLVGYSGSGKSTFVNLILRLYDITSGSITIDSQDIRDVTQDSLRECIGMIPQDPSLFNRSLIDNIRYGSTDKTDAEVIEAAKQAHAHDFIVQLPEAYETLVGERGIKLSGGQRQRIAIARAMLKNAPILILDEATSQLDSLTENLIQESLQKLMENKTTIIVAHRLSTLMQMDRILVFDNGKIVEDGSHNNLINENGLYKRLWDAQVGGFLGDRETVDVLD